MDIALQLIPKSFKSVTP